MGAAASRSFGCALFWVGLVLASALPGCVTSHGVSSSGTSARSHAEVIPMAVPPEPRPVPPEPRPAKVEDPPKELPRGGQKIFPAYRLVGFCGTPGAPALGELQGNLHAKAKSLEMKAAPYAETREILPVFELIAVVVRTGRDRMGSTGTASTIPWWTNTCVQRGSHERCSF